MELASNQTSSSLDVGPAPPGTSTIFETVTPSSLKKSPLNRETEKPKEDEPKEERRKVGLGSLMKEAKSSTKQGAQEFSFDSFGF